MANVFTDVTTPYVEELGIFSFPVYEFNRRFETIKRSNPQLSEEAAAAFIASSCACSCCRFLLSSFSVFSIPPVSP